MIIGTDWMNVQIPREIRARKDRKGKRKGRKSSTPAKSVDYPHRIRKHRRDSKTEREVSDEEWVAYNINQRNQNIEVENADKDWVDHNINLQQNQENQDPVSSNIAANTSDLDLYTSAEEEENKEPEAKPPAEKSEEDADELQIMIQDQENFLEKVGTDKTKSQENAREPPSKDEKFDCDLCQSVFKKKDHLMAHKIRRHPKLDAIAVQRLRDLSDARERRHRREPKKPLVSAENNPGTS